MKIEFYDNVEDPVNDSETVALIVPLSDLSDHKGEKCKS